MNDNDLLTAVKEDFAAVRMDVPSQVIMRAGTSRRRRRRAQGLATIALTAAGLGLAIATLTPGVSAGNARLAAWTVTRQPDGAVAVTIRQLQDIPGLQQQLNADGVPTVVYDDVTPVPGCLDVQDTSLLGAMVSLAPDAGREVDADYFVIHPAAIPAGTTVHIDVMPPGSNPPDIGVGQAFPSGTAIAVGFGLKPAPDAPSIFLSLVYTSGSC
jgi:hypothetical protein